MRPLAEQIKEAQDIRDRCEKDPSLGSVLYWVGRLSALKEAEVIYEAHIRIHGHDMPIDRIQKPKSGSLNIHDRIQAISSIVDVEHMREEFNKCKESSEHFTENYGTLKTDDNLDPHLNSNCVLVVDAEFDWMNGEPCIRVNDRMYLLSGLTCYLALPTTPEALGQTKYRFNIEHHKRGNGYFILDKLGGARARILTQNKAKAEIEVSERRQGVIINESIVIYLRN